MIQRIDHIGVLLAVWLISAPLIAAPNLVPGDTEALHEFRWTATPGGGYSEQTANLPQGWGGNFWHPQSTGVLSLAAVDTPDGSTKAFGIENHTDHRGGQLYTAAELQPGPYALRFRYLTQGAAVGKVEVRGEGLAGDALRMSEAAAAVKTDAAHGGVGRGFELRPSTERFAPFETRFELAAPGRVSLMFQNGAQGPGNVFRFRQVSLTRVGADDRPLDAASLVPQEPDAYHTALRAELAEKYGLTGGFEILGASEDAVISRFHLHGPAADAGTLTTIDALGDQPFRRVMRMECNRLSGEFWHTMVQALSPVPVKQGDVLVVSLYARGGVAGVAGSPGLTGVSIKPIPGDPHGFGTRELVLDADRWQRVLFPVTATRDTPAGKLEWISVLGTKLQWIEFAGMSVINFGAGADVTKLLEATTRPGTYAGREADAPWRAEALARIEQHRKADLAVTVVDAAGNPAPGAQVKVALKEHAFRFGTACVPRFDAWEGEVPDWARGANAVFRKHAYELFNHVAIDIDLKHQDWYGATDSKKRYIVDAIDVLRRHGMTIHGHTMVWPGFHNMQAFAKFKDNPAKLQAEILGHIRDQARWLGDRCLTWDVVNEPYGNQEITRLVGFEGMLDWFRTARETLPATTKLAINEGITPGGGGATEAYYLDITRQLIDAGAPIDSIGLQCHVGSQPPGIPDVWASLERFAALKPGVELAVTEFDINSRGNTLLEGDYTRDLLLIAYSHPQMTGFTMWGFHDPYHWLKYAPLFKEDGTLKESGKAWMDLVHNQWWTRADGRTDASGRFTTRGTLGQYTVTVTINGSTKQVQAVLPRGGAELQVRLD